MKILIDDSISNVIKSSFLLKLEILLFLNDLLILKCNLKYILIIDLLNLNIETLIIIFAKFVYNSFSY